MTQFDRRNLSLMMDLYEMTMANGYFADPHAGTRVTFDMFYRQNPDHGGFAIFAGLEQVIEYLENLRFEDDDLAYFKSLGLFSGDFLEFLRDYRFRGEVYAFPEGTIMYPNEPVMTVCAPLIDAQLIETALLAQINHQSLIATKAQRIVRAARGRVVSDFGARRAHNMDAAVYGARAAYIGGVSGTATVLAGKLFGIPVVGTMAHSWVMYYQDEYTAFKRYAEIYPDNCQFLIDTYDVMHSGVPNAIRAAREVLMPRGRRLLGVRIDSGDLAYLSKRVRAALDEAGLQDCKIIASNSLDEYTISSILDHQDGVIDVFGVGERLITSRSDPVFGGVYKMAAVDHGELCIPRIKVSETFEKITNPGRKHVYRVYDASGHAIADLLTKDTEQPDFSRPYAYVDPHKPWKKRSFTGCTLRNLQRLVFSGGRRTAPLPALGEIRAYVKAQLADEIWPEEQRFENPHKHYLDMSPAYYALKTELMQRNKF